MCLIYTSETERRRILGKYMAAGIADGERIVYLADGITEAELRLMLGETGVDVGDSGVADHMEVWKAESTYCPEGCFSPERMLAFLRNIQEETAAAGLPCLRATGEMGWALRGIPGSERLMEYESKVNTLLETNPFLAICQYDARLFDGRALYHVLQVHPYMIVRGQLLANPCYIGPVDFLKRL